MHDFTHLVQIQCFFYPSPPTVTSKSADLQRLRKKNLSFASSIYIALIYLENMAGCQQNFRILAVKIGAEEEVGSRSTTRVIHAPHHCFIVASLHHTVHQIYPRPDWCQRLGAAPKVE